VLVVIVTLSVVCYRYVETPVRKSGISGRGLTMLAVTGICAPIAIALMILALDGLPFRLNEEANRINAAVDSNYRCPVSDFTQFGASRGCTMNLPSGNLEETQVVLLGNSHAQMYAPLVEELLQEQDIGGLLVPLNGCLPTVDLNISGACLLAARRNLKEVLNLPSVRRVVIGMNWHHENLQDEVGATPMDEPGVSLIRATNHLIDTLVAEGKEVVLIGPIATPGWNLASELSRQLAYGRPNTKALSMPVEEFNASYKRAIDEFSAKQSLHFIPVHTVQCDANECHYLLDGHSLFADSNHLVKEELSNFKPIFKNALAGN